MSDATSEQPKAPATGGPAAEVSTGGVPGPDAGAHRSPDQPAPDLPAPRPAAHRRGRLLVGALAVAVAAAIVAGVVAASLWGSRSQERNQREEVARVAGTMAAALLTYDYEDLDAARERVLALSTGKFRTEYRTAFEGLRTLLSEAKASSRGSVTDVYLNLADGEPTASAIVVVNTVAEGTAGRRATVASYIQLDLVEVDGEWRVDGVTNLNFGSLPVDLGGGSSAPATTAPGAP